MVERRGEESLNKEASWRPSYGGAQWGGSLNKEASWRPLYSGVPGTGKFQ